MRTLVLGAISALTLSTTAQSLPLKGADLSLALGGKMLAGDDGQFYRFYSNGLLEITGEGDTELPLSFGKWQVDPLYLILSLPGSEAHHVYTLDAQGMDASEDGLEGMEGSLDVVMTSITGAPSVSGVLDKPQTIRVQRMLEQGSKAAALQPLPDIVNEVKPVLLANDALRALQERKTLAHEDGVEEHAEGAE